MVKPQDTQRFIDAMYCHKAPYEVLLDLVEDAANIDHDTWENAKRITQMQNDIADTITKYGFASDGNNAMWLACEAVAAILGEADE